MAYSKKKSPLRTQSRKNQFSSKKSCHHVTKHIAIPAAVLVVLTLVLVTLFNIFNSPEHLVKQKITSIAEDYYENYLYETITKTNHIGKINETNSIENILSHYEKRGFASLTLRQLLSYDNDKHPDAASIVLKYCDESATSVQIFPEQPFGKKDYHIEYTYSCNF